MPTSTRVVGTLLSGQQVVERHQLHEHLGDAALVAEALQQVSAEGQSFLVKEVPFGRIIGDTICVTTKGNDRVVFAQRPKRPGLTRFVLNRQPEPCRSLVVILKTADASDIGCYVLVTAFIGVKPEPEPWDMRAFAQQPDPDAARAASIGFWTEHALTWGSEQVIPGTVTHNCPW